MKKRFDAEVEKILHLMIESIYTNRSIFLRELISNASDACDKIRHCAIDDHSIDAANLLISIEIDEQKGTITIQDNGIGMDEDDLINNLGTIASSGTQRFVESIENKKDSQLIGQFGVGFYSAFMVAKEVTVLSTKFDSDKTYAWKYSGTNEYEVFEHEQKLPRGTKIELLLKDSDKEFLDKYKIQHLVSSYSDHVAFPIMMLNDKNEMEQLNKGKAIWTRQQADITKEEYSEFYKSLSHMSDEPWMTLHNRVEGALEYTNLLYIPSNKPFDLFHPDRQTRVKLYIKRVFITEDNITFIPKYLRFLRGVIDSSDLPLNISRETLQHNSIAIKMQRSIVKKVLGELKKKAANEPEEYAKFWNMFGEVLKEGLCEPALQEKDQLLDLCRFHSINNDGKLISLDDYISSMIENQESIYYLTGESIEIMRNNPQLEGFKKRNIDVLLLDNNVDDFWLSVINSYKDKSMQMVSNAGIDLDKIVDLSSKDVEKSSKDDHKKSNLSEENNKRLHAYIKFVLGNRIASVVNSTKIVNSPACLSIAEGSMNIKMEKMLIEQKQLHKRSPKILEINTHHPILRTISDCITEHNIDNEAIPSSTDQNQNNAENNEDTIIKDITPMTDEAKKIQDNIRNLIEVVFTQACLVAGENIDNPSQAASIIDAVTVKSLDKIDTTLHRKMR